MPHMHSGPTCTRVKRPEASCWSHYCFGSSPMLVTFCHLLFFLFLDTFGLMLDQVLSELSAAGTMRVNLTLPTFHLLKPSRPKYMMWVWVRSVGSFVTLWATACCGVGWVRTQKVGSLSQTKTTSQCLVPSWIKTNMWQITCIFHPLLQQQHLIVYFLILSIFSFSFSIPKYCNCFAKYCIIIFENIIT